MMTIGAPALRFTTRLVSLALLGLGVAGTALPGAEPQVFPGATWETRYPGEVGLNIDRLEAIKAYLGGSGFISRHGYQVYSWGTPDARKDIASASKPWYSIFLFKALEDGKLPSLDAKAVDYEPRLGSLNAALKFKDRNITFRQMATQTSCYGIKEAPGTRFNYNDWQMALFWDLLFLKVYGATYENVDATVVHPLLTDILQCEDNPTFMAFGPKDRAGRIAVSPRDFARMGLLFLHQGNWNGKQIISAEHAIQAVTTPLPNSLPLARGESAEMLPNPRTHGSSHIPDNQIDHKGSYSFLWWINGVDRNGNRYWADAPPDVFTCLGHTNGKHGMAVLPTQDIVISWNNTNLDLRPASPHPLNTVFKELVAAVQPPPGPQPGQIIVDPANRRFFKLKDGGSFFMSGPGDPEGFFYRGTRNPDGTRTGDQMALIEKLKGTGANSIYVIALRSHGGDGGPTENPFVNSDPAQGLDDRILAQWETWISALDDAGITTFFIVYDDQAEIWPGDNVGSAETAFIHGLVNRFKHHKRLIWCVAEESREAYTDARIKGIAAAIRAADDRNHPIAVHLNVGLNFMAFDEDPSIDQFTVQWNSRLGLNFHEAAVKISRESGGRFNVNMAEMHPSPAQNMSDVGDFFGGRWRRQGWETAMAGAYSMHIRMDIASTPRADLVDCGRLVAFMESTRFSEMLPHDELAQAGTQYVLAKPGDCYIAYASALSGEIGLKGMTAGTYAFRWFDCVSGASLEQKDVKVVAGTQSWAKPIPIGPELAVYITRTDGRRSIAEKRP